MEEKKYPTVGSQDSGYLYEFKEDGVFLTVYPAMELDMMFELSDMLQILEEYSVPNYDIQQLAKIMRECKGEPIKVGDSFTLPANWHPANEVDDDLFAELRPYGSITIDVSRDRLEAKVRFTILEGQQIPTREMVMDAIATKNIHFGIDLEAVEEAVKTGHPYTIAKGIPPIPGEDAKIIKKFDLSRRGKPAINEKDQANYKDLSLCVIAKKGQVLAERIPHTKGIPGTNVYGDKVPVKNGKPRPMPQGKNTEVKEENFLIAASDGQIVERQNKICIDPELEIKGDVGVGTGNIDFNGGVNIGGDVLAGFTVKAVGDITIKGNVFGGDVVGQTVYVNGGICGMSRGHVIAREDVHVSFVENADVEASGNIFVYDVALHSNLRAGHTLTVQGGKGIINGGSASAGEEVVANVMGNAAGVVTKINVGVNPLLEKKYKETLKVYTESKNRLESLNKMLNTLGKIDLSLLPQEKVDKINALVRSQFPLAGTVERTEKELKEMDKELSKMKHGKVRVKDILYPGVRLKINSIHKNAQVEERHSSYYVEDDFVCTGPF